MKISTGTIILTIGVGLLTIVTVVRAEPLIAYTSFEEPFGSEAEYFDPNSAALDHTLVNVAGQSSVAYTSVGGELGFTSYYQNTQDSDGLADGDLVGVNNFSSSQILAATHGDARYLFSDLDGRVTVTLESVDLTGTISPKLSLDFFFRDSSYETAPLDYAHIWVEIDNGVSIAEIDVLDTRPDDIDALGIENFWSSVSVPLPTAGMATLKFEAETNSPAEMFGMDNIRFTDVPEPTSMLLLVLGQAALMLRRKSAGDFNRL